MNFEEKTLERKELYQGPIFKVVTDQVESCQSQKKERPSWSNSTARRSKRPL